MASQVDLYNMALGSIGIGSVVSSPTEGSPESSALEIWYPTVRDRILGAAFWPSVKRQARLNLLTTRDTDEDWVDGNPNSPWLYAYGLPDDMLRPRFFSNYGQFDIGLISSSRRAIFSNTETPILNFTSSEAPVALWDADLVFAIAHALGSVVCLQLTGNTSRRDKARQLAYGLIMDARASAANDFQQTIEFTPGALIARGYEPQGPDTQYLYPYAEVSAAGFGNVN
jgi:hypothetical protein